MVQTLISAAPKIAPIVYKVFKEDANHFYGNQFIVDYGVIRTTHFKAFDYEDQFLVVEKIDDERSHWWIKNFAPETKVWDGSSLALDKGKIWFLDFDALFRASMAHDVIYERSDAISKATGIPVVKILAFADDLLKILADGYGASKAMTTPLHKILRFGGNMFHKIKKIIGVFVLAALCGCYAIQTEMEGDPPDIHWVGPWFDGEEYIWENWTIPTNFVEDAENSFLTNSVPQNDEVIVPTPPNDSTHVLDDSSMVSQITIKSFGSPDCSKAKEDASTQIKDLKLDKRGLSYRWAKGDLSNWGIKDKHDASALAVAGYGDGKTFKCSKFDWISTDRLTRSFENIYGGYNGFKSDEFFKAQYRCFFIMSKDGKRRTNVLVDR